MDENSIGKIIVDAAIQVHRELGPGLLESVYEVVLSHELQHRGLCAERQVPVAITYCGHIFEVGFRADVLVENKIIVELKCVERINNAHKKQLLTYLRLTGMKLGYLLNFSEPLMKRGITRTVNSLGITPSWLETREDSYSGMISRQGRQGRQVKMCGTMATILSTLAYFALFARVIPDGLSPRTLRSPSKDVRNNGDDPLHLGVTLRSLRE